MHRNGNVLKTFVGVLVPSLLLLPQQAFAHAAMPGLPADGGFLAGFAHPLTGFDHLLAMLAVGLWAAQIGGRAIWLIPATFVAVMLLGAAFGMGGVPLPLVESGILASVLVLGLLVACAVRLPLVAAAAGVGLFALFHGHAHGSEAPAQLSAIAYGTGFAIATAILHAAGIGLALALKRENAARCVRMAGGAVALGGVALCFI